MAAPMVRPLLFFNLVAMDYIIGFFLVALLIFLLLMLFVCIRGQTMSDTSEESDKPKEERAIDKDLPNETTFEIKGIWYRSPLEQMRALQLKFKEPVYLVAEPDNPEDKNAIKVMTADNVHVGYMPRDYAYLYAPRMHKFREACVELNEQKGKNPLILVCAKFDE